MNGNRRRQRMIALVGTLAGLCPAGAAWSQTAPPFSQLLRQAQTTPRVTALQADVARAQGLAEQARARPNPSINVYAENFAGDLTRNARDQQQVTGQIDLPIELGGKRSSRIAAGEAGIVAAQARGKDGRLLYATELARAYAGAEIADRRIGIAEDEVEEATADLQVARAVVGAGKEARLRQIQAETELNTMLADLETAKAQKVVALARLSALAGSSTPYTGVSESLLDRLDARPAFGPIDPMQATTIKIAEAEREAAARAVTVQQRLAIPNVTAQLGVRQLRVASGPAIVAGIGIPLPIFDRNRGNIAAAQAELQGANAREAAARLDAETGSRAALALVEAADTIPGAGDVSVEQTSGAPTFDVQIDRQAVGRLGLSVEEVANTVSAALGGREAGLVFEGDRRFSIVVRLPDAQRDDIDVLGSIPVMLPAAEGQTARSIPLSEVARFRYTEGLNQISRENGKRMVTVQVNVRGRDLGGFVADAQAKIAAMQLPPGMYTDWGGTFESLRSARLRLMLVVPICFLAIYALLYMALGGFIPAAIVFSAVPMALAGGVFALLLRGIPFSITAAVGFIALSGVAVLNGLVMMGAIRKRRDDGEDDDQAIADGAMERVRPVLMTALVASLGFVPMALATGTGAEVQRPLATVVIAGLITSTALTLLVLPAITALAARLMARRHARRSADEADGVPARDERA